MVGVYTPQGLVQWKGDTAVAFCICLQCFEEPFHTRAAMGQSVWKPSFGYQYRIKTPLRIQCRIDIYSQGTNNGRGGFIIQLELLAQLSSPPRSCALYDFSLGPFCSHSWPFCCHPQSSEPAPAALSRLALPWPSPSSSPCSQSASLPNPSCSSTSAATPAPRPTDQQLLVQTLPPTARATHQPPHPQNHCPNHCSLQKTTNTT